ncbi:MAG: polyprenol phosphomannose-dependent alpha 1,6 mannosyltransferase MptB [Streptosporangiaceae bacterium]
MSTKTDSGFSPPLAEPAGGSPSRRRFAGALGWSAAVAIIVSLLMMLGLMAAGPNQAVAKIPKTWPAPPYSFHLRLTNLEVGFIVYAMMVLAAAGVALGLLAVARGARPNLKLLAAGAGTAVALMVVLPPAGSTDSLSYATYGRIALVGHNPYSYTPEQLIKSHDPVGEQTTTHWVDTPSVYGPVQTAAEWGAAKLGGTSISRIVFWLKLLFGVSFGAVAFGLDRVLRRDPAARARAHMLWTVNPLMLWALVGSAHCDALTAGFGVLGLLVIRPGRTDAEASDGQRLSGRKDALRHHPPTVGRSFVSGLLIGAAAGVKIPFALLGVGPAWAARRSPRALAAMVAGAFITLVPGYLIAGQVSVKVLQSQSSLVAFDSFWRLVFPKFGGFPSDPHWVPSLLMPATYVLAAVLAALLLWRLPHGYDRLPAVRPALALMLAWLLVWPMQRPWYDAIAFALLAIFPATKLDWLMIIRTLPAAIAMATTGVGPNRNGPVWLVNLEHRMGWNWTPAVLLAVVAAVILISVLSIWSPRRPPPLAGVTPA